jgi:hypothetical protein
LFATLDSSFGGDQSNLIKATVILYENFEPHLSWLQKSSSAIQILGKPGKQNIIVDNLKSELK